MDGGIRASHLDHMQGLGRLLADFTSAGYTINEMLNPDDKDEDDMSSTINKLLDATSRIQDWKLNCA